MDKKVNRTIKTEIKIPNNLFSDLIYNDGITFRLFSPDTLLYKYLEDDGFIKHFDYSKYQNSICKHLKKILNKEIKHIKFNRLNLSDTILSANIEVDINNVFDLLRDYNDYTKYYIREETTLENTLEALITSIITSKNINLSELLLNTFKY